MGNKEFNVHSVEYNKELTRICMTGSVSMSFMLNKNKKYYK